METFFPSQEVNTRNKKVSYSWLVRMGVQMCSTFRGHTCMIKREQKKVSSVGHYPIKRIYCMRRHTTFLLTHII